MIQSAQDYHQRTSYDRSRMSGHVLDWANQPTVFKTYAGMATVRLPEPADIPSRDLSELAKEPPAVAADTEMDLGLLSRVLHLTHSVTAQTRYRGTVFYYRNVASAGALYPFELYVAALDVKGLDQGLYHQTLSLNSLTLLRSGDSQDELRAAISYDGDSAPCSVFVLTSIFFRSSWKYRDRAYRYHLLDTGHMVENLALALKEAHLPFSIHYDFDDARMNRLLGLDGQRESCLAAIVVWAGKTVSGTEKSALAEPLRSLDEASRVANRETDYSLIREIHSISSKVAGSREPVPKMLDHLGPKRGLPVPIPEVVEKPEVMSFPESVLRRRSMRNFIRSELSRESFGRLTSLLCSESLASDQAEPASKGTLCIGFIANQVAGLDPGFYLVDPEQNAVSIILRGNMVGHMAHICLDQAWLENCAIHFVFLGNLRLMERSYGPRAYRHAMMTAGRLGQRLYLGATSMGLGCCGIGAFYDREAAGMLSLDDDSFLLYLVAIGPLTRWHGRK